MSLANYTLIQPHHSHSGFHFERQTESLHKLTPGKTTECTIEAAAPN